MADPKFFKFVTIDEDGGTQDFATTLEESIGDAKAALADDVDDMSEGESLSMGVYKLVKIITIKNLAPTTTVTSVA